MTCGTGGGRLIYGGRVVLHLIDIPSRSRPQAVSKLAYKRCRSSRTEPPVYPRNGHRKGPARGGRLEHQGVEKVAQAYSKDWRRATTRSSRRDMTKERRDRL